ncbi:MAG: hypothetical protein KME07_24975 [Pegethrix bostrychoides GSE-TBD4-15B]|jgi:hypothetical protein|uniref:TonB C-terminal domain-containing protein n=1 Tax=Pegethrix bostrychoides GSE-TBD4-15B TaxID=2839662 RepID=A0A951U8P0_9CYAN|nr:hypothetical protein [Pegethrix bostrychoides GSE-TBD4-15B]
MANPNSFRNLANNLVSQGQLQALWRNPSAIAAIASLLAHGLLFAALPLLPRQEVRAKEADIKDPVSITELTPAEQSRLPDMVTLPPVELPPISSAPKNGSLFTLPSLSQPNTRTSITPSDSLLAPPPPLPIFIPPILPPTQFPSFSTIQIPPAQPAPVRPVQPQASDSPAAMPSPSLSPAAPVSPSAAADSPPASPSAEDLNPDQVAAQPEPQPSPARTEADIQQDLIARQQELRELYTFRPEGTSVEAANSSFLSWYGEAMGKDYGEGEAEPTQEEVTADYLKVGCPLKKTQRAVVGVVVDAESQIVGDPRLLKSSGYGLFNQEALQVAKAHEFKNESGGNQVYLLGVNFKYSEEVCPPGFSPIAPAG